MVTKIGVWVFLCEEVLFIVTSVVYGFIIGQFMWIFSET